MGVERGGWMLLLYTADLKMFIYCTKEMILRTPTQKMLKPETVDTGTSSKTSLLETYIKHITFIHVHIFLNRINDILQIEVG